MLTDVDHKEVEECLEAIRRQTAEYSRLHPAMPISYAAGYALSSDFEDATMRSLFRHADKNMYIDKNRAKMQEAAEKQKMNRKLLERIRKKGYHFSDCLYCDALLDQGTTFVFRLPFRIDTSASEQMELEKKEESVDFSGMHILLVEDNEINMEIVQFYLEEAGIQVDPAWNGQEAVEKFAQSEPYTYDMILMDIMMPVMDGLQATRKIRSMERADAKTVSILAMTAQANAQSSSECRKAGMNDYIEKPIEAEKLWEIITKNLNENHS